MGNKLTSTLLNGYISYTMLTETNHF